MFISGLNLQGIQGMSMSLHLICVDGVYLHKEHVRKAWVMNTSLDLNTSLQKQGQYISAVHSATESWRRRSNERIHEAPLPSLHCANPSAGEERGYLEGDHGSAIRMLSTAHLDIRPCQVVGSPQTALVGSSLLGVN